MSVKQQIIEHLEEFTGEQNQSTLLAIYDKYRLSAIESVEKLDAAMASGDFTLMYDISHALKGSSNVVGFNDLWQHVALFVEGTKVHDIDKCKAEFEHIRLLVSDLEE